MSDATPPPAPTQPYHLKVVIPTAAGEERTYTGVYQLEGPEDVQDMANVLCGTGAALSACEAKGPSASPARFAPEAGGDEGGVVPFRRVLPVPFRRVLAVPPRWWLPDRLQLYGDVRTLLAATADTCAAGGEHASSTGSQPAPAPQPQQ